MTTTYAGHFGPEALIDQIGRPFVSVPYVVYLTGTLTPATIYTDRNRGGATASPGLRTSAFGNATFYAEPGDAAYDVLVNGVYLVSGVTVNTDPAEPGADITAESAARAAGDVTVRGQALGFALIFGA